MREKAVIPDADEPFRHDVETKSPHELEHMHLLHLTLVIFFVILVGEIHIVVFHFDDPVVRDRDPVSVTAEIIDHVRLALVRLLEKHVPLFIPELVDQTLKQIRMIVSASFEIELVLILHFLERRQKQRSESCCKHFEADKKPFLASLPFFRARVVSASGNDAVEMRMNVEFLTPRMKDREEPYLRSEVFLLDSQRKEASLSPCRRAARRFFLVPHDDRIELVGKREHHVKVLERKQLLFAFVNPSFLFHRLARGAVSVATRIIERKHVIATVAPLNPAPISSVRHGHDVPESLYARAR